MLGAERREAGRESEGSFWSGGDREGRRRWEPGEERGTIPWEVQGEANEVAARGHSPEVRREVKQRSGPQSLGDGPRRELDARVSPHQPKPLQPLVSIPALTLSASSHSPGTGVSPPEAFSGNRHLPVGLPFPPPNPPPEAALQGMGTLAGPDLSICFLRAESVSSVCPPCTSSCAQHIRNKFLLIE